MNYNQQPYYNNFQQPMTYPQQNNKKTSNILATTSLIIGIISLLSFCCLGGFLGVIGAILGIIAIIDTYCEKKAMAIIGIVLSIFSFVLTIIILIIGNTNEANNNANSNQQYEVIQENQTTNNTSNKNNITYLEVTANEMIEELNNNALNAEEKYTNKNLAITGQLSNIDSDGKYISIKPIDEMFSFINIMCYISNEEQKEIVRQLKDNDIIIIYGHYTQVGEVLGYSIDISKIVILKEDNGIVLNENNEEITNSDGTTIGQKNALKQANSYLSYMAFSEQGLRNQLAYEQYTKEEIDYALQNIDVDWNEQAKKKAESYLSYMAFSKQDLINQLMFEGFTEEQAIYGVEQNGY